MNAKELIEVLEGVDGDTEIVLWAHYGQFISVARRTFDVLIDEAGDAVEVDDVDEQDVNFDEVHKGILIEG